MQGKKRYHLEFNNYSLVNNKNGFIYTLLTFITFWILYSYLVPISLFVTLEIVKFWQGFVFMNLDPQMRDEGGESAKCRNCNLNEDLGKIDYVFSDKTGTLTSNEMRLRLVAIKGQPLGDLNQSLENRPELQGMDALKFFSTSMHHAVQVPPPHCLTAVARCTVAVCLSKLHGGVAAATPCSIAGCHPPSQ
jgi:phospholipid-transporting ATPase